jgi:NAD(P)-dependent dehydrogenase (short-subunit alcohol dehydrogenase family)
MENSEFNGKVVIVTGGGRGIGRGVATAFATHGAVVVIAEKDPASGIEAQDNILADGGKAVFIKTDVSQTDDIVGLVRETAELYGRIDIMINNAGFAIWKSPYEITVAEWDEVINTNLRSVMFCSREAAGIMRKNGGGSIVNISSTRAFMSEPNSEPYAASKGGIVALTHALAASFAADRIRVNCISPGWIETGDYTKLKSSDHDQHFSGRVGKPEDISAACLYLAADGNDFINGTNIIIDGGMTRKMIYEL